MEDTIISPTNTRVKFLTDEDTSKMIVGILKKIINSNKQLVAVSGVVKDQCSSGGNKEQLEKERNNLSGATTNLQEDTKAAATTTNYKYVKSLVNKTSSVAKISANLIRLCTTITTETTTKDVGIFKKISTSATTVRDAIFLIVDALMTEVPSEWKDPLAEAIYYDSAKNVEKSLSILLEHKSKLVGDNIIPKGHLNEISAAAIASLISAHRIVVEYEYPLTKPHDIVEDVKIAATASSQLWAAFEDSIKQTDLSISHGNLKNGLLSLLEEVKKEYHNLTEEGKKAVLYKAESFSEMNHSSSSSSSSSSLKDISSLKQSVDITSKKINHLLSVAISLSETNLSEIGNQMVEPSPEDQKLATKLLKEAIFKPLPKVPDKIETVKSDGVTDVNIWDEPESSDNLVIVEDKLKSGTFNKIIERLTSPLSQEIKLMHTFAATYRSFSSPQRLFQKLQERFNVPQKEEKNRLAIQLRVVNVLKHWCETQFNDFAEDYELVESLLSFLNEIKNNNNAYSSISKSIINLIENKRNSDQQNQLKQQFVEMIELEPKIPLSPSRILFVFNEEEIAKQLTFLDFSIYSQIQPVELLSQAWSKDKLKYRSPNIRKLIARSNAITHWVCSLILWQKTLKERIKVLTKIINITTHLRKLNNFNSMIGFVSALNNSSIHRLKHTFQGLPSETTKTIEELKELISATQSYSNYRRAIHNSNPPCIPFLGVYLTDLTFIEEGNGDFVTRGENKLINFVKQDLVYAVIHEIEQYQQTPYIFEYYEQLGAFLQQLPCNDEDSLYKLSLLREPKGATIDQII